MTCEIVTTNCLTGNAEYMTEENDSDRLMKICRASSSMPLVCPIVNIDGIPYLDGGLADSIPVKHVQEKGLKKNSSHFDETGRLPQKTNFQSGR